MREFLGRRKAGSSCKYLQILQAVELVENRKGEWKLACLIPMLAWLSFIHTYFTFYRNNLF